MSLTVYPAGQISNQDRAQLVELGMGQVVAEARLNFGRHGGARRRARLARVGTAGTGSRARTGGGARPGTARVGAGVAGARLSPLLFGPTVGGGGGGRPQVQL